MVTLNIYFICCRSLFSLRCLIIFLVNRDRKRISLSMRLLQCSNTQHLKTAFHLKLSQRWCEISLVVQWPGSRAEKRPDVSELLTQPHSSVPASALLVFYYNWKQPTRFTGTHSLEQSFLFMSISTAVFIPFAPVTCLQIRWLLAAKVITQCSFSTNMYYVITTKAFTL